MRCLHVRTFVSIRSFLYWWSDTLLLVLHHQSFFVEKGASQDQRDEHTRMISNEIPTFFDAWSPWMSASYGQIWQGWLPKALEKIEENTALEIPSACSVDRLSLGTTTHQRSIDFWSGFKRRFMNEHQILLARQNCPVPLWKERVGQALFLHTPSLN